MRKKSLTFEQKIGVWSLIFTVLGSVVGFAAWVLKPELAAAWFWALLRPLTAAFGWIWQPVTLPLLILLAFVAGVSWSTARVIRWAGTGHESWVPEPLRKPYYVRHGARWFLKDGEVVSMPVCDRCLHDMDQEELYHEPQDQLWVCRNCGNKIHWRYWDHHQTLLKDVENHFRAEVRRSIEEREREMQERNDG